LELAARRLFDALDGREIRRTLPAALSERPPDVFIFRGREFAAAGGFPGDRRASIEPRRKSKTRPPSKPGDGL
jgi:hypothetical protein